MMSGTALSPWNYLIDSSSQFRRVAKSTGFTNWDTGLTYDLADQFKELDALELVFQVDNLFAFPGSPPAPVRPCIEGNWEGAFLTEDPRTIWAEGRFVPKPIVIGVTSDDATFVAAITTNQTRLDTFNQNIYDILPVLLEFDPRFATEVLDFYFGDKHFIDETNEKIFFEVLIILKKN